MVLPSKTKRLKPTTLKLLADAPAILNCLKVYLYPPLPGGISKTHHLILDIQWVLIGFLIVFFFFLVWGWLIIPTLKVFQAKVIAALLYGVSHQGLPVPFAFCWCPQRINFLGQFWFSHGCSPQATSRQRLNGCTFKYMNWLVNFNEEIILSCSGHPQRLYIYPKLTTQNSDSLNLCKRI